MSTEPRSSLTIAEHDDTGTRIVALDLALRYAPSGTAESVVDDASTYLAFLKGEGFRDAKGWPS